MAFPQVVEWYWIGRSAQYARRISEGQDCRSGNRFLAVSSRVSKPAYYRRRRRPHHLARAGADHAEPAGIDAARAHAEKRLPHSDPDGEKKVDVTGRILWALQEAITRCGEPAEAWMAEALKQAMILIGNLDEDVAKRILDQEGL